MVAEEALCCGCSVAAVECESVAEALEELPDTREVDSTDGDTANEPVVARKTINSPPGPASSTSLLRSHFPPSPQRAACPLAIFDRVRLLSQKFSRDEVPLSSGMPERLIDEYLTLIEDTRTHSKGHNHACNVLLTPTRRSHDAISRGRPRGKPVAATGTNQCH